ncbi:ribonuclease H-like domain-containing protein [Tanacetum coccineum]
MQEMTSRMNGGRRRRGKAQGTLNVEQVGVTYGIQMNSGSASDIIVSGGSMEVHEDYSQQWLIKQKFHRAIAELTFEEIFVECMIWEESVVVTASVNAVEMINPLNEQWPLYLFKKFSSHVEYEEHFHEVRKPSLNIHTYIPKANSEGELKVKVLFLHNSNYNSKLYILSSRARTMWDISLINVKITIPWENGMSEMHRLKDGSLFDSSSKNTSNEEPQPSSDAGKEDDEGVSKESRTDQERPENNTQDVNTIGPSINTASTNINTSSLNINTVNPTVTIAPPEASHADFLDDETKVDMSNITTTYLVPSTLNTRIHKDHLLDHVIGDVQSGEEPKKVIQALKDPSWIEAIQEELLQFKLQQVWTLMDLPYGKRDIVRIEAIRLFLAYASFMGFMVYQMDVKSNFLYERIKEEVYVCQPPGFEDPDHRNKVKQKEDGIFISQDKYVDEILNKFGFSTVKIASTPMETSKPLLKDAEAEDVDVHLYRSMIGSLMYLTASRPDIMFTDSPFDLEAYTDSDYAGARLDRKSTRGGCQFLRRRLISWQCKKQTIVANSTTEAEYVAAASCCGQTKHIEIRHHFIRDSNEKKLIQMIKIYTDQNVADLLTKAFDVGRFQYQTARKPKRATEIYQSSGPTTLVTHETVHKEMGDRMERDATIAASLDAEHDSDSLLYLLNLKLDHCYLLPVSLPELFVTSHGVFLVIVSPVVLPPRTAEETLAREKERKARTTLLLALPEDHLAKFHKITNAKEMWEAIKSRFGGNDESKKMFQSLLSQLEIHGAGVSTEDANQKFLRSLPSAWSQVALVMRTKPGVDSISFDDLYNNLRVFETDVKGSTGSSSNLEQLDEFDLEEIDLKWQVAMISMRLKKFYKKSGKKILFDAKEPVRFDKTKVECYNCHKTGHFARECKSKGNQDSKRKDAWNSGNKANDNDKRSGKKEQSNALMTLDGGSILREQLGDASIEIQAYTQALKKVEAQLVAYQQNQLWYEEKIKFMKIDLDDKTNVLTYHKKLLAEAIKEKEELKTKFENWQNSSKNLGKLLDTQISANDKFGLGYGDHIYDSILSYENEVLQSVFINKESDVENQPLYDRFVTAARMHVVPPPMTGNYMPSGPDIEIDYSKFTYGLKQSQTSKSENQTSDFDTCESNSSEETLEFMSRPVANEPKIVSQPKVWSDAPIIEEYESDSDDDCVSTPLKEHEQPSFAFDSTAKHVKTPKETVKEQHTYSKSSKVDKQD